MPFLLFRKLQKHTLWVSLKTPTCVRSTPSVLL
ncbi:hypothetical protein Golob_022716 [Gossypium lobatum]|uniref:Uncharacterized protein n=2 Tax=Gossypium TaxID=3633 RepID=A0A7J8WS37_GOSAI|nr:hypothetical protein [Gossypium lobatum]MBA0677855.1 hypothetical protein [Gossypium aridum]